MEKTIEVNIIQTITHSTWTDIPKELHTKLKNGLDVGNELDKHLEGVEFDWDNAKCGETTVTDWDDNILYSASN